MSDPGAAGAADAAFPVGLTARISLQTFMVNAAA